MKVNDAQPWERSGFPHLRWLTSYPFCSNFSLCMYPVIYSLDDGSAASSQPMLTDAIHFRRDTHSACKWSLPPRPPPASHISLPLRILCWRWSRLGSRTVSHSVRGRLILWRFATWLPSILGSGDSWNFLLGPGWCICDAGFAMKPT